MTGSREIRAFKRWMKQNSVNHRDTLQLVTNNKQLSVTTLTDLKTGDTIATIPKQSCLTVKSCSSDISGFIQDSGMEGYLALSLALMYEKSLRHFSKWFAYFKIMPDANFDLPLLWSLHQLDQLLLGTELHKVTCSYK